MKKNDIVKTGEGIFRIISVDEEAVLAIDCEKKMMPKFFSTSFFENGEILENLPFSFPLWDELSPTDCRIAQKRYTMIAAAVAVIGDKQKRNSMIDYASRQFQVSKQTLRSFLCSYLAYQDIAVLAPKKKREKELTKDQKNIRWALNKFFYTRNQNSLSTAYTMMLKAKYCDAYGNLVSDHPSFNQFRYFYRKHKKIENFHISREGLTAYQRNNRPLLGNGVQEFAPYIGTAMLDSTICDIYLVDEKGELQGRPILTAACDANTSMCLGYVLSWENDVNSLKKLMINIIEDKVSLCERMGISISKEQWNVFDQIPGVLITDQGHEYTSQNFEQISELGITLINLPPYRPELKSIIEKFFDLIQTSYKGSLKGKGVIMPDFSERGAHDYRKDAVLTLKDFEKIVVRCIIHYNCDTKIIACIQIQTPADCSVKGLLLEILRKADEMLFANYYKNAVKSHSTVDMLIGTVSQVALNHIGLLIVDEIQNVVNSKNGKIIIGTLTQLINNAGVSICMVGTPESTIFFEQECMLARRSLGLNYTAMSYDDDFRNFCYIIFNYCYVQQPINIDEALLLWLYQHSDGNASVIVSIIHNAQEIAILENIECLDISTLNLAFERRMTMLRGFLNVKATKVNTIKKKKTDFPNTVVSPILTEDIKIYQIVMNAKELQKDIVTELNQNGFNISEVAI